MKLSLGQLALAASSLGFLYPALVTADASSSADSAIPTNVPVQQLLDSANALLAQGDMAGALSKFDAAIKKDPSNYLTIFKRGATYLSLGRPSQANADFDAVLTLKPDFEAALLQRAKLKTRAGEWGAAKKDYKKAGSTFADELNEIEAAEKAVKAAKAAMKLDDWPACIDNADAAIKVAPQASDLRSLRAECKIAKGEVEDGINDLIRVAAANPALATTHVRIASLYFYSLSDAEHARAQLKKCLHFDQDSKSCKQSLRRIRTLVKSADKIKSLREKSKHAAAVKLLIGDEGHIADIRSDIEDLKKDHVINNAMPTNLLVDANEFTCDSYVEMGNYKRATPYCDEVLKHRPNSLPAAMSKAKRLIAEELFEEAIRILEPLREHHQHDQRLGKLAQEAQTRLRQSKQKDYYKILGVSRDASEKEIKKAYRALAKEWHPDKYRGELSKNEVEKKYSGISEAFEVLSSDELRARFDRGDDPNDHSQQNPFAQGGNPFGGGGFHHGGFPGGGQQFFQGGGGGFPFGQGGAQFKFNF